MNERGLHIFLFHFHDFCLNKNIFLYETLYILPSLFILFYIPIVYFDIDYKSFEYGPKIKSK